MPEIIKRESLPLNNKGRRYRMSKYANLAQLILDLKEGEMLKCVGGEDYQLNPTRNGSPPVERFRASIYSYMLMNHDMKITTSADPVEDCLYIGKREDIIE